jgi:predicted RNA-binding protein YlxR (DUF448 family)
MKTSKSKSPLRTCVFCRQKLPKAALFRLVKTPENQIKLDPTQKLPGRGMSICQKEGCFSKLINTKSSKLLEKNLKTKLNPQDLELILSQITAEIEKT